MPEYTVLTVCSVVLVVAAELWWLRTGLFTSARYWCSMAIVFFFQGLVDGWLTKLDAPVVLYGRSEHLGLRAPWDIPIEDFGFGFSMVTLTILLWERAGRREQATRGTPRPIAADDTPADHAVEGAPR